MASDLLFIIDVTVSMKPYRDAVRAQFKNILDLLEVRRWQCRRVHKAAVLVTAMLQGCSSSQSQSVL